MEFCLGYYVYKERVIEYFFLDLNSCCGNSKETSHWDFSLEYPKHKFKLMDKNRSTNLLFSFCFTTYGQAFS